MRFYTEHIFLSLYTFGSAPLLIFIVRKLELNYYDYLRN
jgi:hypothetical protein